MQDSDVYDDSVFVDLFNQGERNQSCGGWGHYWD
jgi:hypothetical protein